MIPRTPIPTFSKIDRSQLYRTKRNIRPHEYMPMKTCTNKLIYVSCKIGGRFLFVLTRKKYRCAKNKQGNTHCADYFICTGAISFISCELAPTIIEYSPG